MELGVPHDSNRCLQLCPNRFRKKCCFFLSVVRVREFFKRIAPITIGVLVYVIMSRLCGGLFFLDKIVLIVLVMHVTIFFCYILFFGVIVFYSCALRSDT